MKAILEFDLNDHDDAMAHMRAVKSQDLVSVLWTMALNSKKSFQYEIEGGKYSDQYELLDAVYAKLWDEMNAHGINLESLTQ